MVVESIDSAIRTYWYPEVKRIAKRYVGRHGAELDDLVQEGIIFVWQSLQRGIIPKEDLIRARMRNWCRTLEYQTRYTRARPEDTPEGKPDWLERFVGGLDHGSSEDS